MPENKLAGFERIHKLIKPLITEIKRYSRQEKHHWHIDDTGWKVFVLLNGKNSSRLRNFTTIPSSIRPPEFLPLNFSSVANLASSLTTPLLRLTLTNGANIKRISLHLSILK